MSDVATLRWLCAALILGLLAGVLSVGLAPVAGGLFLGDYMGLSSSRRTLDAFFQQTVSTDDRTSGFFRRAGTRGR